MDSNLLKRLAVIKHGYQNAVNEQHLSLLRETKCQLRQRDCDKHMLGNVPGTEKKKDNTHTQNLRIPTKKNSGLNCVTQFKSS